MLGFVATTFLIGAALQVSTQGVDGVPAAGSGNDSLSYSGRDGRLEVSVPRVEEPGVEIDGILDEAVWGVAAALTEFTQYEPVEGIPSTESTEIRVFYSDDAIYFGIKAFDDEPEEILARLGERDRSAFGDDWVRIMLDTFDDKRQAYVFYVNPLGLQTDGLWIEGMQRRPGSNITIDFNPDFIWESKGLVTSEGWSAEIKIPYVSLRFRETPVQAWGINVAREVKRSGFKQAWAPLTRNETSTLAQSGRLVELRDLKPRRLIEFNPVTTGKRTGRRLDDGAFARDDYQQEFSANARYGLTNNLVLDATINPDFSQVEADVSRLTVNERFAIFFAEKRPFFLEGTEIFRTPRNLVHTRTIIDPDVGAKVTGKVGSFNVGYLGSVDRSAGTVDNPNLRAVVNLVRARRDVGQGSTVGLLYTDRTLSEGGFFNRVLSGDARLLLGGRYTLTTQFAGSWTNSEPGSDATFKPLMTTSFARSGRTFGFQFKIDDVHPGFNTRSGFIPRIGDTELSGNVRGAHFGKPGSTVESVRVEARGNAFFEHNEFWGGGSPFESEVEFQTSVAFKGEKSLTVLVRDGFFRFQSGNYGSYEVLQPDGSVSPFAVPDALDHMLAVAVFPRFKITNEIQLNGRMFYREIPIFSEAARGLELQVVPDVTLRPTNSLQVSLSHTYSRIWRQRDDSVFSTVNLTRFRTQYQFSNALFVRVIVQYDLQDRTALRDPGTELPLVIGGVQAGPTESGQVLGQFLLSYEPSPGTIFFVGYSRLEQGDRTYRLSRLNLMEDGLFVKLSYLFRL